MLPAFQGFSSLPKNKKIRNPGQLVKLHRHPWPIGKAFAWKKVFQFFHSAGLLRIFDQYLRAAAAGNGSAIVSDGGMLQVVLGLGFVLALMGGLAWLLRRFGGPQPGSAGTIKILGGSAVGQRERVVLVEVADTWLVVGVAPGHVTALHTMPKGEVAPSAGQARDNTRFSTWLRQTIEKQMIEKQKIEKQAVEKQTVETPQGERNGE